MAIWSADGIIRAFVERSARDSSHVTFAERSPPNGYVRVHGPNANALDAATCHVIIERLNGTISVTEELKPYLAVRDRPDPPVAIQDDPAGFSSGPRYGRYAWSIIGDERSSPDQIVDQIVRAFAKAQLSW